MQNTVLGAMGYERMWMGRKEKEFAIRLKNLKLILGYIDKMYYTRKEASNARH